MTRLILEHVGYPYSTLMREPAVRPGPEIVAQIKEIVSEINTGRPIQYILGYTYFLDLKIYLTNRVLIPRPETEEMLHHITSSQPYTPHRILDLGTGSGCIALGLKRKYPESSVTGIDISKEALKVAERNGILNHLHIEWREWDMIQGKPGDLPGKIDLMVSNPPYVREKERHQMHSNVLDFEPAEALFVPDLDPLIFHRAIALLGRQLLSKEGAVWVEINENLADETSILFERAGYRNIQVLKDIHDKNRFIRAIR